MRSWLWQFEITIIKQPKTKLNHPDPVEIDPIEPEIRLRCLAMKYRTKNYELIENQAKRKPVQIGSIEPEIKIRLLAVKLYSSYTILFLLHSACFLKLALNLVVNPHDISKKHSQFFYLRKSCISINYVLFLQILYNINYLYCVVSVYLHAAVINPFVHLLLLLFSG